MKISAKQALVLLLVAAVTTTFTFYFVQKISEQTEDWMCSGIPYVLDGTIEATVGFPISVNVDNPIYGTCGTFERVKLAPQQLLSSWQFYADTAIYFSLLYLILLGFKKYAHTRH